MLDFLKSKRVLGTIVTLAVDVLIQFVPELEPLRGETFLVMNAIVMVIVTATTIRPAAPAA